MNTTELAKLLGIPELPAYLKQVEQRLEEIVASSDNPDIREPALRVVRTGGKRLRPVLCLAAALSRGGKINDSVISAASAIELAHIATLIHDDIIDDSDLRRGIPTINSREGVDNAIIIGDYLLSLALVQAATASKEAACEGQMQEKNDEYNVNRSISSYLTTINKKTAALTAAACRIGGLCGNLADEDIYMLAQYGEAFGMAFQITDDVLDFLSTTKLMGKPVGNDVKEGVYTMPLLLAIQGSSGELVKSWLGRKPSSHASRELIVTTLSQDGAFDESQAEINKYNNIAASSIKADGSTVLIGLSELPHVYEQLALKKQSQEYLNRFNLVE
jgi:geranylgeranyl pyrophosphate synthase